MRHLVTALVFAGIVLAYPPSAQCRQNHFRVGGSGLYLVKSNTRDILGTGWAVTGEYSFNDALSTDEAITGDISVCVSYKMFDKNFPDVRYTVDYSTFGLKWRGGKGAQPDCEGLYGGIGLGGALLRMHPSLNLTSNVSSTCKLEYTVCGGANFLRHAYAEISFSRIPDIDEYSLEHVWLTIGARF